MLATPHGFVGLYVGSRFSRSPRAIAGESTSMERDYDYYSHIYFVDLDAADEIGQKFGERTVKQLSVCKAAIGPVDVFFRYARRTSYLRSSRR